MRWMLTNGDLCTKLLTMDTSMLQRFIPSILNPVKGKAVRQVLLDSGMDVDAVADKGRVALHLAAQKGHARILKVLGGSSLLSAFRVIAPFQFLIDRGAEIDVSDEQRNTPLHIAAMFGRSKAAKVCVRLEFSCSDGCTMKVLVDAGSSIAFRNVDRKKPAELICIHDDGCTREVRNALLDLLLP